MYGKKIKELRFKEGISQLELAVKLNVTQSTVSSWEIERTQPSFEIIEEMTNIFGCSVLDILGEDRSKYKGQHIEITDSEKKIIEFYRTLDEREQKQFYQMLAYVLAFNDMKAGDKNEDTENRKNR